ncbi:putative HVA22-like protein g [Lycium barbarum]|uniref:putative HVA22-like protein g n=1 Tax=Lycium barbarum TaxID=112863 RepID=UPI00293F2632|nr:putative HVA22-like protein g [Lycium barbarum]
MVCGFCRLVLGYAYPAFECFKTIEKNRVEIEELRFWCQYWIIVAALRIFESFGDLFMSWLPMYSEAKLALFIYLWYPKTKGTAYIYNALLKPYVATYEKDIDRSLLEFRAKGWDLAISYWQNCAELGQAKFLQMLDFIASQSKRGTQPSPEQKDDTNHSGGAPPNTPSGLFKRNNKQLTDRRPPPGSSSPPPPPRPSSSVHHSTLHTIKSEPVHHEDASFQDNDSFKDHGLHAARAKLRRKRSI